MTTFHTLSRLTLGLIVSLGALWSSSYAFELNSSNIENYECYAGPLTISCDFSSVGIITSIASGTFINHPNLEQLNLNYNWITSIESGDFAGLANLTQLSLDGNDITSIESGDFSGLANLTSLILQNNQITSIESGDFDGLSSLTELYLSLNQITSIESGDFTGLYSLTQLSLEGNRVTSIESGDFDGLSSLTYLNLQNNQITSIESGDFAGLGTLTSLGLGDNQITSIESDDFIGLGALTTLFLETNQITSIESGDFAGLANLTSLILQNNQITSIESGDFDELSSLTELSLEGNQVTSIESGDFAGLSNIQSLNLVLNCLNTDDILVTSYLDTLAGIDYSEQQVCLQVQYSPSTSGSVMGNLSFVGPTSMVAVLSGENPDMTLYDHVFTGNGSHVYDYSSLTDTNQYLWSRYMTSNYGIPRPDTVLGSVTWIDTTPPTGTLSYSTTGITNQSVTATLTLNETGIVNNNSGSLNYIFSGNGEFIFEYQDSAGNTGATTASVTWIDTTAPTIMLNGSGTLSGYVGTSYTDAGASWTDAVAGSGTLIGSGTVNTSLTGTYTISYNVTDTAGNTSTAIRTVTILPVVIPPVVIVPPVVPRSSGGGGGGGGNSVLAKDNCPAGDYSSSYYDKSCGTKPTTTTPSSSQTGTTTQPIVQTGNIIKPTLPKSRPITTPSVSNPTQDDDSLLSTVIANTTLLQRKSYEWAVQEGITTVETVAQARLDNRVTRAELAKMLSVYATDVLGQTPSDTACEFEDADKANKGLVSYMTQACQLGIMGLQSDGNTPLAQFRPNAFVTRAEFGTALSRVLYGTTNNTSSSQWREGHLENLYKNNIINITAPTLQEQRGWAITTLYKTTQE